MGKHINAKVFRYDPDKDKEPYYSIYRVEVDEELSALMLLDRIQKNFDETLSLRSYSCGLQMCKSCIMKINNKKKFACLTMVKPGEDVLFEPASYPEYHVKDLVTIDPENE